MTDRMLAAFVAGVVSELRSYFQPQLAALETRAAALEQRTPHDGTDGIDGTDGAPGRDGVDGRPGADGKDGRDGLDADPTHLATLDAKLETLEKVITALTPRDGRDGKDGAPGSPGAPGPVGPSGTPGRDAMLKGAVVLKRIDVRRFQFCWDDGTPMTVIDEAGTVMDSVIRFPVPVRKGLWTGPAAYEVDDVLTDHGSEWMAKCDTTSRPGNGSPDWELIVKRGAEGPKGKPGEPGPPGRDLTQMDDAGRKW